jgi:hypothetical protein
MMTVGPSGFSDESHVTQSRKKQLEMIQPLRHSIKRITALLALPFAILVAASLPAMASSPIDDRHIDQSVLDLSRTRYLSDLLEPHHYRPGKNSFLLQTLHKGQRKTLLELAGSGSVRHLWSTWSIPGSDEVPAGRILLRVFVDNELNPSIAGTVDELCHAAQNTGTAFVPYPAFIYKDAYNFYLPIYFSTGIRIEAEALDEINEFYTQIDYRIDGKQRHFARLVSKSSPAGLTLWYIGNAPLPEQERSAFHLSHSKPALTCNASEGSCEFSIKGPGVLRKLTLHGDAPPDLVLEIYWDNESSPSVKAPTKYFFADFINAAVESRDGEMTSYFPMPFRHIARIVLSSASKARFHLDVDCSVEQEPVSESTPYFHAFYHAAERTTGYSQYPVLQIRGTGLFVGMNLFDSGHNHGGGDVALIDAGTTHPLVLHGICGEDYFGFAWHHVGTMTPLTGAPVHERRYRLHLENPYPFSESIQFLFGTFAGLQPKSVAFWYEFRFGSQRHEWTGLDTQWKVLGPLGPQIPLPQSPDDEEYRTTVAINKPVDLVEQWQEAQMQSGFLDLTYQFRHYTLVESGTGFVPGASKTALTTYVHSDANGTVNAVLGHDDGVLVQTNGTKIENLPGGTGFSPSSLHIPLRKGWNTLELVLLNEENTNWRWSGVSLAFENQQTRNLGLRFSSEPPPDLPVSAKTKEH